ncbi:DUF2226 domain-containing protein [Geopsychrobacter electrodiphilus]|uniref:DUF2226 domain-containing protein n=1 Tax=Geopsychrobacter electrodiphilus TaxID=225196 RepID=UPI0003817078|nr:DUF2226 domain-containing protein [Geopsychrobacter electrodiphilus]
MILLPKGSPVKENVNPARVNLPEAMEKLVESQFSGYLRFDSPVGTGIIIFENGHLISALMQEVDADGRIIAYDAISRIFEMSIFGNAVLNIYRLNSEVAMSIHALLHGEYIYRGQDLKLINIQDLLGRIRSDRLSGCLRVYSERAVALVFYEAGHALGFLHEGAMELETTADLSVSVAAHPGAKLDLLSTVTADGIRMADLMASADLGPMWEKVRNRLLIERKKREVHTGRLSERELNDRYQRFFKLMRGIAERHIGQYGVMQVEKALKKVSNLMSIGELDQFFVELTRAANLVVAPAKVREMIDEMRRGVNALL